MPRLGLAGLVLAIVVACGEPPAPTPALSAPEPPARVLPGPAAGAIEPAPPVRRCPPIEGAAEVQPRGIELEAGLQDRPLVVGAIALLFERLGRGEREPSGPELSLRRTPDRVPWLFTAVGTGDLCPQRLTALRYEHHDRALAAVELADRDGSLGVVEIDLWSPADADWTASVARLARDAFAAAELRRAIRALPTLAGVRRRWATGGPLATRLEAPNAICLDDVVGDGEDRRVRCFSAPRGEQPVISGWGGRVSLAWRPSACFAIPWPEGAPQWRPCSDPEDEGHPTDALPELAPPAGLAELGDVWLERSEDGLVVLTSGVLDVICFQRDAAIACSGPIARREEFEMSCHEVEWAIDASGDGWAALACARQEEPGSEISASDRVLLIFRSSLGRLHLQGVLSVGGGVASRTDHEGWEGGRTEWETEEATQDGFEIARSGCVTVGAYRSTITTRVNGRRTRSHAGEPATPAGAVLDGAFPDTVYERIDTAGSWAPEGERGFRRAERCPADPESGPGPG